MSDRVEYTVTANTQGLESSMGQAAQAAQNSFRMIGEAAERGATQVTSSLAQLKRSLAAAESQMTAFGGSAKAAVATYAQGLRDQIQALVRAGEETRALAASQTAGTSATAQSVAGLQALINTNHGLDRTINSARQSMGVFSSHLATQGLTAAEAAVNANHLAESMAKVGSNVRTMAGPALQEFINTSLVLPRASGQAERAAAAFAEQIERMGSNVRTVGNRDLRGLIDTLNGVGQTHLSAAQSAAAFTQQLPRTAEGVRYSLNGSLQEFINTSMNVRSSFGSAAQSASTFASALPAVTTAANTASESVHKLGVMNAGVTREMIVLGREALTGSFSRIPGSLMVLGERLGNVSSAVMGMVGAFGAALLIGTELLELFHRLQNARLAGVAGGAVFGLSKEDSEAYVNRLRKLRVVTTEQAGSVVNELARTSGMTKPVMDELTNQIQPLAIFMNTDAPNAAKTLSEAFGAPTRSGRALLQTFNTGKEALEQFDRAMMENDVVGQRRIMLEQLARAMDQVREAGGKKVVRNAFGYGSDDYAKLRDLEARRERLNSAPIYGGPVSNEGPKRALDAQILAEKTRLQAAATERLAAATGSLNTVQRDSSTGGLEGWLNHQNASLKQMQDNIVVSSSNWKTANVAMLKSAVDFWTEVGNREGLTFQQRVTVSRNLMTAKLAYDSATLKASDVSAKKGLDSQLAALSAEQSANHENFAVVMELQDRKLEIVRKAHGVESSEYQKLLKEKQDLLNRHHDEMVNRELESSRSRTRVAGNEAKEYAAQLAQKASRFEISQAQRYMMLDAFEQRQMSGELALLDTLVSSLEVGTKAWQKAMEARDELTARMAARHEQAMAGVVSADERANRSVIQAGVNAANNVWQTWTSSLAGIMQNTMSWRDVQNAMMRSVLQGAISVFGELLARWSATMLAKTVLSQTSAAAGIAAQQAEGASGWGAIIQWALRGLGIITTTETAKTGAVAAGAAARTAATAGAAVAGGAAEYAMAVSDIAASAARAGAGAFAATAAIPIVGPGLAPGAAASAYAATIAFVAAVPPLATGTMDVPRDMLAFIHKGEMVVPKTFAEGMRESGMGSAPGGNTTNTGQMNVQYSPTIHMSGSPGSKISSVLAASRRELVSYLWQTSRNGGLVLPGRAIP